MKAAAFGILLAVAAAPAAAQQLTYTTTFEFRTVPIDPAPNPVIASLRDRVRSTVVDPLMRELGERAAIRTVLSSEGMRLEAIVGGPALMARPVVILKPDGQAFVLQPADRSYWGFSRPPSAAPPARPAVEAVVATDAASAVVAGVETTHATFTSKTSADTAAMLQLLGIDAAKFGLGGEAWIARRYLPFSVLLGRYAGMAWMGPRFEALDAEGLVMHLILRGDVMDGHELERTITSIAEGPLDREQFLVPANYHAVAPPLSPVPANMTPPTLVTRVDPTYTQEAMRQKIQGVVRLQVTVLIDGTVSEPIVVESLDKVYGLDQQAIAAVRQWKFAPAKRDGVAVAATVTVQMQFKLH